MTELRVAGVVLPWAVGSWPAEPRKEAAPALDMAPLASRAAIAGTARPKIGDADRLAPSAKDVIAAAVALDVLCTTTSRLCATPTVLCDAVDAAFEVAAAGYDEEERAARACELRDYAMRQRGTEREAVASRLTAALSDREGARGAPLVSPASVIEALRRIEEMSLVLVREALALLEAGRVVTYHQA